MKRYFNLDTKIQFIVFLTNNQISETEFAKKIGLSKRVVMQVANGDMIITPIIAEKFKKGGFEIK